MIQKLSNSELNRLDVSTFKETEKLPVRIILDNLRSLSNVGSIFRTSDAFLIKEIILCGITAVPPHREIQKTALGATETVNWRYFKETSDAIKELKEEKVIIYAIEQASGSISLDEFIFPKNKEIAIVFGNEVHGVDDSVMDLVDACIEIPQFGTKHSLNVSISAGILIWDLFQKIKK
jgi:23S rRNA (guanosine2251-2'-O)-methyltransferase